MSEPAKTSKAKQRIIETAERLFYASGVRAVGIDKIIAEAGVAKMTLYNHFKSKDDLILAVLVYREEQFDRFLDAGIERHQKRGENLLDALFRAIEDWFLDPEFRGCSFINTAVELAQLSHPASQFAKAHKERFRDRLAQIISECFSPDALVTLPGIALLIEGAIVTAQLEGQPGAARLAKEGADVLLEPFRRNVH